MIAIIFLLLIGVVLAFLMWLLVDWATTDKDYPRIKFNDFKKFYALNPNRWYTYDDKVECRIPRSNSWFSDNERFIFNFVDHCKYKLWYHNLNKKKKNDSNAKSTQRMLDVVREDIKKHQSDAERNVVESLRTTIDVVKKYNFEDTMLSLVKILKQIEEQQSNDTKLTE